MGSIVGIERGEYLFPGWVLLEKVLDERVVIPRKDSIR